jgi:hypothetical protein
MRFCEGHRVCVHEPDGSPPWKGVIQKAVELPDGVHEYVVHVRPATKPPMVRCCLEAWMELVDRCMDAFS